MDVPIKKDAISGGLIFSYISVLQVIQGVLNSICFEEIVKLCRGSFIRGKSTCYNYFGLSYYYTGWRFNQSFMVYQLHFLGIPQMWKTWLARLLEAEISLQKCKIWSLTLFVTYRNHKHSSRMESFFSKNIKRCISCSTNFI